MSLYPDIEARPLPWAFLSGGEQDKVGLHCRTRREPQPAVPATETETETETFCPHDSLHLQRHPTSRASPPPATPWSSEREREPATAAAPGYTVPYSSSRAVVRRCDTENPSTHARRRLRSPPPPETKGIRNLETQRKRSNPPGLYPRRQQVPHPAFGALVSPLGLASAS
ncbi:Nn.00g073090.m01.CDS01 [Neocucurbitaria sp. VM-36]